MEELQPTQNRTTEIPVKEDVWIHSACEMCYASCGVLIHRVDGVIVKVEGDPECPHNLGKQCAKGQAAIMTLYDPHRVKAPLRRTNPEKGMGVDPKWETISWEEALNTVCERLKKIRRNDPRKLIFSTFDIFLKRITHAWQAAFGIEPMTLVTAFRCGAGLHSATYLVNGTFHNDIDLEYCNYCILFGSQLGFLAGLNPMPMAGKMAEARERGMKLVVIDPRCSNAAAKADEWIPVRPGTDGALALAMLHVLLNERELYDQEFIKKHTNGCYLIEPGGGYVRDKETNKPLIWDCLDGKAKPFDAEVKDYALEGRYSVQGVECSPAFQLLKEQVKGYAPELVSDVTTVPAATIRRIAQEFGEAARIGSKIVIEGQELPYRPAAAHYYKGIVASGQATWQQLSILLLNFVVGSFYSPGGYNGVHPFGPPMGSWSWVPGVPGGGRLPKENEDGLMLPAERVSHFDAYAPTKNDPLVGDRSMLMRGACGGIFGFDALSDPEKYKPPVKPEAAIICRTNWALSRENKKQTLQALLNIPFIVCFSTVLDETAEFADVVLPDAAIMERLVPFPNSEQQAFMAPVTGHFYWGVAQPAVKPAGEAIHWCEVLLEIADRMGFLKDFYGQILPASDPAYQLDPKKKYNLEEILDRVTKSHFGPDRGLEWFNEHGYMRVKMTVEERYPILAFKPRIPIYYEHFLRGAEEVRTLMRERNITGWDASDYVALPHWKPSPAYERRRATEYDLYCINYTDPLYFKTISPENAWLSEIGEHHPRLHKIEIYTDAAKRRGIEDGDLVWVESTVGKVKGTARVTECIHPEVVAIGGTLGSWAKGKPISRGKGVHHNSLIPVSDDRVDPLSGAIDQCVEVKVYKAEE